MISWLSDGLPVLFFFSIILELIVEGFILNYEITCLTYYACMLYNSGASVLDVKYPWTVR